MPTYYVDPLSGSDGAAGTSFGAAWATTQKAADTATAGDEVRLCKTATETITTVIDIDTNVGTFINRIKFISYDATGASIEDGYTIQATATIAGVLEFATSTGHSQWEGVIFDGNANATKCIFNNADGSDGNRFIRCRFTNATGDNIGVRGTGTSTGSWHWIDCENDLAGIDGFSSITGGRGHHLIIGGSIHDCVGDGSSMNSTLNLFHGVLIYDNGGHGIEIPLTSSQGCDIVNCVIFGNTLNGVSGYTSTAQTHSLFYNNAISGNGGYGYDFNQSDTDVVGFFDYNLFYNNTSGDSDQTLPGDNNVTGSDPLFTSVTDGSEDFIPLTGSPLIGAGLGGSNIGAKAHADGGGSALPRALIG